MDVYLERPNRQGVNLKHNQNMANENKCKKSK